MPIYTYSIDGPKDRTDNFDGAGRVQTHSYTLVTDDPTMDEFLASAKFSDVKGIVKGTAHPSCSYAYCKGVSCDEETKSKIPNKLFKIKVNYATNPDTGGGGGGSFAPVSGPAANQVAQQQQGIPPTERIDNPLLRPWDFSSDCSTYEVATYCDRNGLVYCNTLGDMLLPPKKIKAPVVKYTLGKNFILPMENLYRAVGAVNTSAVTLPGSTITWGVETLKFDHLQISRIFENAISYYRHNFNILSGPYWTWDFSEYLGWIYEVPNVGKRAKVGTGPSAKVIPITDDSGCLVSDYRFLDADGYEIDFPDGSLLHWLRFHPENLFNMAGMFS